MLMFTLLQNQRQLQTILSQKNVTNIIAETFEEGHKGTFKLDQLQVCVNMGSQ